MFNCWILERELIYFWGGYFDKNVQGRVFWGDFRGRGRFKAVSIIQRGWGSIINTSLTLLSITIIPWTSAQMWCNCSRLILAAGVYKLTQSPASVCVSQIYHNSGYCPEKVESRLLSGARPLLGRWNGEQQEFRAHSRAMFYVDISFNR